MGRLRLSRTKHTFSLAISTILLIGGLSGCDNSDSVDPGPDASAMAPGIDAIEIPSFWVFGSTIAKNVSIQLDLPASVREAVLSGSLEKPKVFAGIGDQPTNVVSLLDDGGSIPIQSDFDFVEEYSGDLIPNDFIYNLRINSAFAAEEGIYEVRLYAGWFDDYPGADFDATTTTFLLDTMTVEVNSPPIIEVIDLPDSLHSGFEPQVWTITVSDPDEQADDRVTDVTIHLILSDTQTHDRLFTFNGDHEWSLSTDSTFAVALETRDYPVEIRAIDVFEQETVIDTLNMWIENSPPLLFNVVVPDTVILPLEGANQYTFYASSSDQQGLGDIEKVYFTLRRPDGETRDNNGLGFSFGDYGIPPDEVADDGNFIYDFPLARDPENPPVLGTYIFYFFALDRAGNLTGPISKEIVEVAETSETL